MRRACGAGALALAAAVALAAPGEAATPRVAITAFRGDLGAQQFVTVAGDLVQVGREGAAIDWAGRLQAPTGETPRLRFRARSVTRGQVESWSYRVENSEPGLTVCGVTFPILEGVRPGPSWEGSRILWPGMYQGALLTRLTSAADFEAQCKQACKGVPNLFGRYVGDLCLPLLVHQGPAGSFSLTVLDPTHEVFTLEGFRREAGMSYQVTTSPRIISGASWRFGDIELRRSADPDWHPVADRYRQWLISQGLRPELPRRGDIATFMYGRWDGLKPREAIRLAQGFDAHDVCLWVVLYGRGDQYYPCYFPPPAVGVEGMKQQLGQLRAAGLAPYFYVNGYLLSPLQTARDAQEWTKRMPEAYPAWLAKGDAGYAETVAQFRAQGHDFAGDWLQTPGGIEPLRVRRVSFQWGEFPLYMWHLRPFWAACVADPRWRKLMGDSARLHAGMGAGGIFMDQVAAMHPELCAAGGHGHDADSFGMWNRAYLRLLAETKQAGEALAPGFFIETEGAADLYARTVDRYLCHFDLPDDPGVSFPRLLRYAVPWTHTEVGAVGGGGPERLARHVKDTLLLGCIFRFVGGPAEGAEVTHHPALSDAALELLRAGVRTRRALADWMDRGSYRDDAGLQATGCDAARWFEGDRGVLIAARAAVPDARVRLSAAKGLDLTRARALDWRTGAQTAVQVRREAAGLVAEGLHPGLNLILIPAAGY